MKIILGLILTVCSLQGAIPEISLPEIPKEDIMAAEPQQVIKVDCPSSLPLPMGYVCRRRPSCPADEIMKYTYMTKEELVNEYCTNKSAAKFYEESIDYISEDMIEFILSLDEYLEYKAGYDCVTYNYENVFRILRKDHGIEKEEDIKCE